MNIPPEFRELALRFHQDMFLFGSTEEELIANALRGLTPEERAAVKGFVTDLLAQNPSDATLAATWEAANGDWYLTDTRRFMAAIRDMIE